MSRDIHKPIPAASPEVAAIVAKLAQPGWRIRIESDEDGYRYSIEGPSSSISSSQVSRLVQDGWLESAANGASFRLSDEGRKSYLRSTDELGDGKLYLPSPTGAPTDG